LHDFSMERVPGAVITKKSMEWDLHDWCRKDAVTKTVWLDQDAGVEPIE